MKLENRVLSDSVANWILGRAKRTLLGSNQNIWSPGEFLSARSTPRYILFLKILMGCSYPVVKDPTNSLFFMVASDLKVEKKTINQSHYWGGRVKSGTRKSNLGLFWPQGFEI